MEFHQWKLLQIILIFCFIATLGFGLAGQIDGKEKAIFVTEVEGIINPISQRHITRSIVTAEREEAAVIIIVLNTPGGLLNSTRKTFTALLNAKVPTVVFVAPSGSHAASAGTFIASAAHLSVMAPGTSIGAATPVSGDGNNLQKDIRDKSINAASADIRSIAKIRGRNIEELNKTVTQAKSFSSYEAVDLNVVNFIASDLDDLLLKLDGRSVIIDGQKRIIITDRISVRKIDMSLVDRFLHGISDPNIALILLSLGSIALVAEILHPGLLFPGITGVICLILAFMSLGNLPVNWAGAGLILLAAGLVVAEAYISGFGILGFGAIISFILGALLMFSHFGSPSPVEPHIEVSLWVLVPLVSVVGLVGSWILKTIVRQSNSGHSIGQSPTVGMYGTTVSQLNPTGTIRIKNETWTAHSNYGTMIETGVRVKIVKVDGTLLTVIEVEDQPSRIPE